MATETTKTTASERSAENSNPPWGFMSGWLLGILSFAVAAWLFYLLQVGKELEIANDTEVKE